MKLSIKDFFSVTVTKSVVSGGFGHFYGRNPWWKTSFFYLTYITLEYLIRWPNSWDTHCAKSVQIRSFFWSVFIPNTGKYEPEKTLYLNTFHVMISPLLFHIISLTQNTSIKSHLCFFIKFQRIGDSQVFYKLINCSWEYYWGHRRSLTMLGVVFQ